MNMSITQQFNLFHMQESLKSCIVIRGYTGEGKELVAIKTCKCMFYVSSVPNNSAGIDEHVKNQGCRQLLKLGGASELLMIFMYPLTSPTVAHAWSLVGLCGLCSEICLFFFPRIFTHFSFYLSYYSFYFSS